MVKYLEVLEHIRKKIHTIRGQQVMLDSDLARLYNVSTKRLNEQVKRNSGRFPSDFMFELTKKEYATINKHFSQEDFLRSQNATLEKGKGKHRKYLPYAFTEQGVAMLSSVLKSKESIDVNIKIMRAFVAMRRFLIENEDVIQDLHFIKSKVFDHDKYFEKIFSALESNTLPKKGIFFDGQVFSAYKFVIDLIKTASKRIILIDNYVDEQTLNLLTNK
jgi:hypothetical protein